MRIIDETIMTGMEEMLNEQFDIYRIFNKPANEVKYFAMLQTIERLGFDWKRDDNGNHRVFGNYFDPDDFE